MPPTPLAILKMKVEAFKTILADKKSAEKKGNISWAFAEEFNQLLAEAKKVEPAMAEHLPSPVAFLESGYGIKRVQPVDYLHMEIKIEQIIGVIKLFET